MGAAVSDHPKIVHIVNTLAEQGRQVSLSSLRPDRLNDAFIGALKKAGARALTTALDAPSQRLRDPRKLLQATRARLITREQRISASMRTRMRAHRAELRQLNERLARTDPRLLLAERRRKLAQLQNRLLGLGHTLCQPERQQIARLAGQLSALSPLASLSRGYAIVLRADSGRALLRAQDARPGDALHIRLHEGTLRARVDDDT